MSPATFCPATMCPLFAADGSPWTGNKNSRCPQKGAGPDMSDRTGCAFWQGFGGCGCDGATAALSQIDDMMRDGGTFQIGPVQRRRNDTTTPKTYDCARAHECQWQREAGDGLCPPRKALSLGLDPRACAY